MGPLEILEQWVEPITGPLKDFRSATEELATNHQTSVTNFKNLIDDLTNPASNDAFMGDGANAVSGLMDDYTLSEFALSGTTGALAGPVAEAAGACATAVASVGGAVEAAAGEVTDTGPLLEVTEVVDVTTAVQGGLDVPEDVVAAGLSLMEVLAIVVIIVQLIGTLAFIWYTWQSLMNDIAGRPRPKLPNKPKTPTAPAAFNLTPEQQKSARRLEQEFPNISPDIIEELLASGLTEEEIRALLRSGNQAILAYVLAAIKTKTLDSKTLKDLLRNADLVQRTIDDAQKGKVKKAKNYHGRLPSDLEQEILSHPDAVYVAKNGRFIFRKGDNIVVTEGAGSGRGSMVTSYGPAGPRGSSGAASLGGSPSDPGAPVTDQMIINGTIPDTGGGTIPPATRIYP